MAWHIYEYGANKSSLRWALASLNNCVNPLLYAKVGWRWDQNMKILILIDLRKHVSTCFWFYFPYTPNGFYIHENIGESTWFSLNRAFIAFSVAISEKSGPGWSFPLCFSISIYLDLVCRLSNSRSSPRMKWTGSKKFSSSSEKKEEEVSKK